jgi:HD-GYP domain-containing protein (c-di-GMP phosphodiesterase class II)
MAGRDVQNARSAAALGATKTRDLESRVDPTVPIVHPDASVPLAEVVSALSHALDITEGQPEGHADRTCLIGMRVAEVIGLSSEERSALFYALLLKDLGSSSNASPLCSLLGTDDLAAKRDLKTTDWTRRGPALRYVLRNVAPDARAFARWRRIADVALGSGSEEVLGLFQVRCERGSEIALALGFPEATATAIRALDEHWDGAGKPHGMRGEDIPLLARIAGLSQSAAVFFDTDGAAAACAMARARKGRWFDPALVDALSSFEGDTKFWAALSREDLRDQLVAVEPPEHVIPVNDEWLDRVALGFAQGIDAKSPWTARHSENVAGLSVAIGKQMGLVQSELRDLRRASLLHDIGKLGVSNRIWDKPSFLTDDERAEVRRHPTYTRRILSRVSSFRGIANLAGAHHERLDGRGYDRGLHAAELSTSARILTIADLFDALASERPYRQGIALDDAMRTIRGDVYLGICPRAFEGLVAALDAGWARLDG